MSDAETHLGEGTRRLHLSQQLALRYGVELVVHQRLERLEAVHLRTYMLVLVVGVRVRVSVRVGVSVGASASNASKAVTCGHNMSIVFSGNLFHEKNGA